METSASRGRSGFFIENLSRRLTRSSTYKTLQTHTWPTVDRIYGVTSGRLWLQQGASAAAARATLGVRAARAAARPGRTGPLRALPRQGVQRGEPQVRTLHAVFSIGTLVAPLAARERNGFFLKIVHRDDLHVSNPFLTSQTRTLPTLRTDTANTYKHVKYLRTRPVCADTSSTFRQLNYVHMRPMRTDTSSMYRQLDLVVSY
jgi:hypothetical protein